MRMFGLRMLTATVLTALLVPLGGASPAPVPEEADVDVSLALNTIVLGSETFYVFASNAGVEMWRETNGCAGLQKSETFACNKIVQADTRVPAAP